MSNQTLFADVLQGKKKESELRGLELAELRRLRNCARTKIDRELNKNRAKRAEQILAVINEEISKLSDNKAKWHTEDPETLSYDEVRKAIKSAQWYKHTYGPAAQKVNKAILKDKNHRLYTKAQKFMAKAEATYEQACKDEAYWINILDRRFPTRDDRTTECKPNKKTSEIQSIVTEMESRKKLYEADKIILERLKSLL